MKKLTGLKLIGLTIKHATERVLLPSQRSQAQAEREIRLGKKYSLFFRPERAMLAPLRVPLAKFAERNEAVMAKRRELLKSIGMPWAQIHETLDLFRMVKAADIAKSNKGVCEERAARKVVKFLVKELNTRIRRERKYSASVANYQYFAAQAQKVLAQAGKNGEALAKKGVNMGEAEKTLLVFHPTGRKKPFYIEADPGIFGLAKLEAEMEIAEILGNKREPFHLVEMAFRQKHGLLN